MMRAAIDILKAHPKALALSIGVPVGLAGLIGQWAFKDIRTWYKKLKKPSWTPPDLVFAPVWTALYSLAGAAAVLVLKNEKGIKPVVPLAIYGVQLVLNLAWQPLFFKSHKLDVALADCTALLGAAVATTVAFSRVNPVAGYMFAPTVVVVAYAAALNGWIAQHNPDADKLSTTPPGKSQSDVQMAAPGKLE